MLFGMILSVLLVLFSMSTYQLQLLMTIPWICSHNTPSNSLILSVQTLCRLALLLCMESVHVHIYIYIYIYIS